MDSIVARVWSKRGEELPEDVDEEHCMEVKHREGCGGVGEEEDGHLCQGGPYGVNSEGQTADLEVEDGEHRRPHLLAHGRGEELPEDVDDEDHGAEAEHHEDCADEEEVEHPSPFLGRLVVLQAVVIAAAAEV